MLYVSVRWSKLHWLNLRRSMGPIGRSDDMTDEWLEPAQVFRQYNKMVLEKCIEFMTKVGERSEHDSAVAGGLTCPASLCCE